eukprot:scaffold81363_cov68-Phaeocystis_antarctica.AAC.6
MRRPRRARRHLGGNEPWQLCLHVRALRLSHCQLLMATRLTALASARPAPASARAAPAGAAALAARAALAAPGAAAPAAPSRAAVDGTAAPAVAHSHPHRHRCLRRRRLHGHHALRRMARLTRDAMPPPYPHLPTSQLR